MRRNSHATGLSSEEVVKEIRRATHKRYSSEEKIRIVLDGLHGEHPIAEPCRREGVAEGLYGRVSIGLQSRLTYDTRKRQAFRRYASSLGRSDVST